MALTRQALDGAECDKCGGANGACTHDPVLYLRGRCHLKSGLSCAYDKRTGVLTLACKQCGKMVGEFQVAEGHNA